MTAATRSMPPAPAPPPSAPPGPSPAAAEAAVASEPGALSCLGLGAAADGGDNTGAAPDAATLTAETPCTVTATPLEARAEEKAEPVTAESEGMPLLPLLPATTGTDTRKNTDTSPASSRRITPCLSLSLSLWLLWLWLWLLEAEAEAEADAEAEAEAASEKTGWPT